MHALLSATLKVPELSLDPKEGQALAVAFANLQRFYPVHVTEKALAWANVMSAVGMVYGTRIAAIGARKAAEKRNAPSSNIIRPAVFQQRPPIMTPQAPVATPDHDPTQASPQTVTARPSNSADEVFSRLPPELI